MRFVKALALVLVLSCAGCATYHKQNVQFSGITISPQSRLTVSGSAQPIGVSGLGPMIWDVIPEPSLPFYAQARLSEWVDVPSTVSVDCSVASATAQVSNSWSTGTIAANVQMSCATQPGGSFIAVGRDVRQQKVGMKGIDLDKDLQPSIDACLRQIADQITPHLHQ